VELERSFFGKLEQISELMEGDIDLLCRGQVISFCQSYEDLDGASMGCGFIENRRAAVELFQAGSDFYGKTFNVIMSIVDSQLLEKLKFNRRRNGEGECCLKCDTLNSCIIYVRRALDLSFREAKDIVSVNKMELVENCAVMEFEKSWFYRVKFRKRLLFEAIDEVGKRMKCGDNNEWLSVGLYMKNLGPPLESDMSFHDENVGSCFNICSCIIPPSFFLLFPYYCRVGLKSNMFYLIDQRREHVGQWGPSSSEDG
jgi:hypothetical protein